LITRALPEDESRHRSIIATTDFRAQGLYLKAGVLPRFPIYYFSREPEVVSVTTNLVVEPVGVSDETLDTLLAAKLNGQEMAPINGTEAEQKEARGGPLEKKEGQLS